MRTLSSNRTISDIVGKESEGVIVHGVVHGQVWIARQASNERCNLCHRRSHDSTIFGSPRSLFLTRGLNRIVSNEYLSTEASLIAFARNWWKGITRR